jgi:hypothetical protein
MRSKTSWILLLISAPCWAQTDQGLAAVIARLDKLEQQNRELMQEVQALRQQLVSQAAPAPKPEERPPTVQHPPAEERLEVLEQRTQDLAQTKIEASQRLPISLTGMLLFNAFWNGAYSGAQDNPTVASLNQTPRTAGGTLRQTVLGLKFLSPTTVLGAQVNGSLYMDFYANPVSTFGLERAVSNNLSRLMRLRVATVELDWGSTNLLVGQDKPILSPREPNSLAQVGVSPLTGAGNPWLWQPQARIEHRFRFSNTTDLRAQVGVFQTSEQSAAVPTEFAPTLESVRPGLEGRFAFHAAFLNDGHIEFAPGFHVSTTHVAGTSVPSRMYSVDWSIAPTPKLDFSGMFFAGENTANLGTLRQGFTILGARQVIPVHSLGGWAQLSYSATPRLTFNIYGGQHDDRNSDLRLNAIGKNFAYAGNALYRIAPNVILGFETMQVRTNYIGAGRRLNNHYDLALAYQF